jgi:aminoglycoside 6'-N-acetyltransferase I
VPAAPSEPDGRRLQDVRVVPLDAVHAERAAAILVEAFAHMPGAWADLAAARAEVATFLAGDGDRLGLAALEGGRLVGWAGALRHSPHAWELHPLAVEPARQRRGVGRALVAAVEAAARAEGTLTLWLGTDDDFGGTSLFGADLYPDVLGHLARLAPTAAGHPFAFYRRLGYAVVGVLPDAAGPGRHDILMAKRL